MRVTGRTWALIGFLVVAATTVVSLTNGHVQERALVMLAWMRSGTATALLAYFAIYLAGVVIGTPVTWTAAIGGYLFGAALGFAVSYPAAVLGSCGAFLAARYLLRDLAVGWSKRPRFAALDEAVTTGGVRLVMLLRFSPLAQSMVSFSLAVTRVRLREFALGSALGLAPLVGIFAYAGSLAATVADALSAGKRLGPVAIGFTVAGGIAVLVAAVWMARTAKAALARRIGR